MKMPAWNDLTANRQPAFELDRAFYDAIRAAHPRARLAEKFVVEPYSGRGFLVKQGQTFRVIEETGQQIGAVAMWNAHERREDLNTGRTTGPDSYYITMGTRLWSDVPWFRPMATCVDDTVAPPADAEFHHHTCVGGHCTPETMQMRFGVTGLNACRLNLLQAVTPFGLNETDLRDSISVHQKMWLDPESGSVSLAKSEAKRGDYVEFYAEMDLLVAVSVCPLGDGTVDPTAPGPDAVRPLGIEIRDTGIAPKPFPRWTDWRPTWKGRWVPPN
jgi:uncharacterized protein YcgI (DUF1989 family)